MLQLLYISSANRKAAVIDMARLLEVSQRRNCNAGVTGLLFSDGRRFLQVLEGEDEAVGTTFARIERDPRHHAVVVLSRRRIDVREFGSWAMAQLDPSDSHDAFAARLSALLDTADPSVRGTFLGLMAARKAA